MKKVIPVPHEAALPVDYTLNDASSLVDTVAVCERLKISLNEAVDQALRGIQTVEDGCGGLILYKLLEKITSGVYQAIVKEVPQDPESSIQKVVTPLEGLKASFNAVLQQTTTTDRSIAPADGSSSLLPLLQDSPLPSSSLSSPSSNLDSRNEERRRKGVLL
jgi:hypothetical protein